MKVSERGVLFISSSLNNKINGFSEIGFSFGRIPEYLGVQIPNFQAGPPHFNAFIKFRLSCFCY
ncbi:MAG: hypothetical protein CM15mP58_13510 [Burkholderiaceae bacterium]|nr:MAG: hypothetical protein CM15mP58_13510 [Burkholderiaceae bacterium]